MHMPHDRFCVQYRLDLLKKRLFKLFPIGTTQHNMINIEKIGQDCCRTAYTTPGLMENLIAHDISTPSSSTYIVESTIDCKYIRQIALVRSIIYSTLHGFEHDGSRAACVGHTPTLPAPAFAAICIHYNMPDLTFVPGTATVYVTLTRYGERQAEAEVKK